MQATLTTTTIKVDNEKPRVVLSGLCLALRDSGELNVNPMHDAHEATTEVLKLSKFESIQRDDCPKLVEIGRNNKLSEQQRCALAEQLFLYCERNPAVDLPHPLPKVFSHHKPRIAVVRRGRFRRPPSEEIVFQRMVKLTRRLVVQAIRMSPMFANVLLVLLGDFNEKSNATLEGTVSYLPSSLTGTSMVTEGDPVAVLKRQLEEMLLLPEDIEFVIGTFSIGDRASQVQHRPITSINVEHTPDDSNSHSTLTSSHEG